MPQPAYQVTFHTNDPSAWGTGVNRPLTWVEHDQTHWNLTYRIGLLEAAGRGKQLDYIVEAPPGSLTVHYTDHSIDGPFPIPIAQFTPRGLWQPGISYNVNDLTYYGDTAYLVLVAHTSAATFDPGATDGFGHSLYGVILVMPGIPVNTISAATYTLQYSDSNTYIRFTNPGGCVVSLPPWSVSLPWAPFTEIHLRDATLTSGGGLSVAAIAPVEIDSPLDRTLQTAAYGGTLFLKNWATDKWDIGGLQQVI